MPKVSVTIALILLLVTGVSAAQDEVPLIVVGDPAPAITDVRWVRGEPIDAWEPGHVYVIDFWATWCPPCIKGLRDLQDLEERLAQKNVHAVAVAVWPTSKSKPPEAVLDRMPELSYSLAIDRDNATADALLAPTRSTGLPTSIIVDRRGRLAWVGAPGDGFEEALEATVAGTYDLSSAQEADRVRHEAELFIGKAAKAERNGEFESAIELIDQAIAVDPDRFAAYRGWQYEIALLRLDDPRRAQEVARQLLESPQGDDPYPLFVLATRIVNNYDHTPSDQSDLDLALHCARGAVANSPEPGYKELALVARVYALRGEYDAALTAQRTAMSNAAPADRATAENALAEYQSMAEARAR